MPIMAAFFSNPRLVCRKAVTYAALSPVKQLLLACAGLSFIALTGCATSAGTDDDGGLEVDAALKDAPVKDTGKKDQAAPVCIPTCTSDDDCSGSCPDVPGGVNCCDTSTGICYAYASSTCPAPPEDAGTD